MYLELRLKDLFDNILTIIVNKTFTFLTKFDKLEITK